MCHDSFICVPWLIHICATTFSYVCHDSFTCVPCDMTHSYVTWLIHMCATTHSYTHLFQSKRHVCHELLHPIAEESLYTMCVCGWMCVWVSVCLCVNCAIPLPRKAFLQCVWENEHLCEWICVRVVCVRVCLCVSKRERKRRREKERKCMCVSVRVRVTKWSIPLPRKVCCECGGDTHTHTHTHTYHRT